MNVHETESTRMARFLLEAGADPNGQVYASGTPLSEAYGRRDEEMIALLERFGGKSNPRGLDSIDARIWR
jgi:hypothetical protein